MRCRYILPLNMMGGQIEVIDYYLNFAKTVFERYKNKVKYWITFNEINAVKHHPYTSLWSN